MRSNSFTGDSYVSGRNGWVGEVKRLTSTGRSSSTSRRNILCRNRGSRIANPSSWNCSVLCSLEEPDAGNPHVRFREGPGGHPPGRLDFSVTDGPPHGRNHAFLLSGQSERGHDGFAGSETHSLDRCPAFFWERTSGVFAHLPGFACWMLNGAVVLARQSRGRLRSGKGLTGLDQKVLAVLDIYLYRWILWIWGGRLRMAMSRSAP